jgi:prepilin-type N-terminal cleavage/methylation domain-containing protein
MLSLQKRYRMLGFDRAGVSLIEVLTVIAIVSTLFSLLLAAVSRTRESSNRLQCSNNLRQISLALHSYHGVYGQFPPGVSYRGGRDAFPFMTWLTRLLPFVEQEGLWKITVDAYARTKRWKLDPPHVGFGTVLASFTCPNDERTRTPGYFDDLPIGYTSYLGVAGIDQYRLDGVLFLDSMIRLADIRDGTSNTVVVGERPPSMLGDLGWWYAGEGQGKNGSADSVLGVREVYNGAMWTTRCPAGPYTYGPGDLRNQCDAFHFWNLHSGGAFFVFCDGTVRFLSYSSDHIITKLATRSGGDPVDAF